MVSELSSYHIITGPNPDFVIPSVARNQVAVVLCHYCSYSVTDSTIIL